MKIASSIIKLLIEDNEVCIRNFGMFHKELENAGIHPITKEVTPPYKKLMFTLDKDSNPERLENLLAIENNISLEEAKSKLQLMVDGFNDSLKATRRFEIQDFVDLKLNIDDSFDVVVKKNVIFDKEYFSLPAFQIQNKPIEPQAMEENNKISNEPQSEENPVVSVENQEVKTSKESQDEKKKKSPVLMIIILLLIFGALGTLGFLYQDDITKMIKGEEKEVLAENKEVPQVEEVEVIVEEPQEDYYEETMPAEETYVEPSVNKVTTPASTNVGNTSSAPEVDLSSLVYAPKNGGKYYVIAGSFKRVSNAANLVSQLKKKGYSPVVMAADDKGFVRVAYKSGFDTERAARDLADELYENKNELPWIHKY